MFKLEISTDNAAFEDNPDELAQIVEGVANSIRDGVVQGMVRDSNGNTVGTFSTD